jgi:acetylglutamate kinase
MTGPASQPDGASPHAGAGPIVVKIGGSTLDDIAAMRPLWGALVGVARAWKSGVVVVHGGGKAVDALLGRLGMGVERREGLRVTPPEQVEVIAGVLAGSVNKSLVGALQEAGARAVGLCLGDGGMVRCERLTRVGGRDLDLGAVGRVTGGDGRLIGVLVGSGYLPVVSSIGLGRGGELVNVNADDAAAGLARVLGAARLVLVTDVAGVRDGSGRVLDRLTAAEAEAMIARGEITGGMIPKVRAAVDAARASGSAVVIVSAADPAGLARVALGGTGGGTGILPDA